MTKPTSDPIVAEVRAAREQHAARIGNDLKEIFRDIQRRQKESGRTYVHYPARSATTTATAASQ